MTRVEAAERIAHDVHAQWSRRPSRAGVLPALRAVAMRVTELNQSPEEDEVLLYRPLTPAQTRTLQVVATGLGNAECAAMLGVSEKTVKGHLRSACQKLGATSRVHAVVLAHRLGIVDLDGAE
jgi:DNA-binding CsgD family transcriptional regulator